MIEYTVEIDGEEFTHKVVELNKISNSRKVKLFDRLYAFCMSELEERLDRVNRYGSAERGLKDAEYWVFEEVMQACLGKDIFDFTNRLC